MYLVLRNYEKLPDETTNDVDMLIGPENSRMACRIVISAAAKTGWSLSNVGRFSCISLFFYRPDTLQQAHIDLMTGNLWHSMVFADHAEMLKARVPVRSFFAPSAPDEAWIGFATRLLYGGYIKEKYRPKIRETCRTAPSDAKKTFGRFVGKRLAEKIVELCASGEWKTAESLKNKVRARVVSVNLRSPFAFVRRIAADAMRLAFRLRRKTGLRICIVSCDSGLGDRRAAALKDALAGTFYPERTVIWTRWNRKTRLAAWKNEFHGGLSIFCLPASGNGCDVVFSDATSGGHPGDGPGAGPSFEESAARKVLSFMENRCKEQNAG